MPASGPLLAHLGAEPIELGRAPAGVGRAFAGLLDQVLLLDQPAEIRLVHEQPGQRLDAALQLRQA